MEHGDDWSRRVATAIGRRVAHYRAAAGLTAQAVADRCAALGHPLDRSVIAKLEKGHRHTVSQAEVIVLARVLGVAPTMLVFPLGQAPTVELLPGQDQPTWDAVRWFTGAGSYPDATADTSRLYTGATESTGAVGLYTIHEGLVTDWVRQHTRIRVMHQIGDTDSPSTRSQIQTTEVRLRHLEGQIRECRESMRGLGFDPATLPPLPPGLAWLDTLTPDEWAAYLTNGPTTKEGDPA